MLRMSRGFPVSSNDRPPIIQNLGFRRPNIQHRLDGETIPGTDRLPRARTSVIRDLRRLMHPAAYAVAGVIANDPVAVLFRVLLNDRPDVAHSLVRPALFNTQRQTFFSNA